MYQRYAALLEKRGITTYQVCKDTGINQSTIAMWKNRASVKGTSAINIKDLKKIADYFGVTIDYFLEE